MKRAIDIEAFATWAFVEELPKQAYALASPVVSHAATIEARGRLGTAIDDDSAIERGFPALLGAPHPDALAFRDAWSAIDETSVDWSVSLEELLADRVQCVPLIEVDRAVDPDDDRTRRADLRSWYAQDLKITPTALVRRMAIQKTRPVWHSETPTWDYVRARGKPKWFVLTERSIATRHRGAATTRHERIRVEEDGWDAKRRRTKPGAYRKALWFPDPAMVARDRAEYVVWWRTLKVIAESLGALRDHRVTGPCALEMPWRDIKHPGQEEPTTERQILNDLSTLSAAKSARQTARKRRANHDS